MSASAWYTAGKRATITITAAVRTNQNPNTRNFLFQMALAIDSGENLTFGVSVSGAFIGIDPSSETGPCQHLVAGIQKQGWGQTRKYLINRSLAWRWGPTQEGGDTGLRSEERRVGKECRSRWSP